jgi:hypothetical protein
MKRIALSLLAAVIAVFLAEMAHAEPPSAGQTDVSMMTNGATVGPVRLPAGASFRIVSDREAMLPRTGDAQLMKVVASGNVTLIAHIEGREIMTLKGDELVLTRR